MFAPLTPKTYPTPHSRSAIARASTSFIASPRLPDRGRRVVAGVREPAESDGLPLHELPAFVRPLDVHRDRRAEEVPVFLERLDVRLARHAQRFTPVPEKERIRLIRDENIDRARLDLGRLARLFHDRRHE